MKSQQLKWQEKMKSLGRCPKCGSEDTGDFVCCRMCRFKMKQNYLDKKIERVKKKSA